MDPFLLKFASGYPIPGPRFIEPLPEGQKTTAKEAIPGASFVPGGFRKGHKVFKDVACILCLLKLRILGILSCAVRAESHL